PERYAGKILSSEACNYLVVDFDACRTIGGASAGSRTSSKRRLFNFHGPINHRCRNYIYTFEVTSAKTAFLHLYSFKKKHRSGEASLTQTCVYQASDTKQGGNR